MDVSRYNFLCQKALYQGLQYAKSFGHMFLEVEHVALTLIKSEAVELEAGAGSRLQHHLQKHLSKFRRVFGSVEIEFGTRLDKCLDKVEAAAGKTPVDEHKLWEELVNHSEVLKKFFQEDKDFHKGSEIITGTLEKKLREGGPQNQKEPITPKKAEAPTKKSGPDAKETKKPSSKDSSKKTSPYQIPEKLSEILEKFTVDLTAIAERGELDPVIGRELETRRVLEILGRKKKNNPILIGEAGVGKTAVAECLALRIAEGRVPQNMKSKRVLSLDLGSLVAGARFRGEFEDRVKNLLQAIKACEGEIILFIDEIHMLVGTGRAEGSPDAANLLKPALARGELHCLGATTLDEYRTHIEKDPALERRFQAVKVEEASRAGVLSILRGIKSRYEIYHGVQIHDEALTSSVDLSVRFIPSRRLPDKAIDLLDEACSRMRMQIESIPAGMEDLRSQIEQLEIEKSTIAKDDITASKALGRLDVDLKQAQSEYTKLETLWTRHKTLLDKLRKWEGRKTELETLFETSKQKGEFEFAAKLQYVEIPKAHDNLKQILQELATLQKQHSWLRQVVGSIEIAHVIATWTGIPVDQMFKEESANLLKMEERIGKRVFGQEEAVIKLSKAVRRARVGINDPRRPLGVFLFIGPTGVGKTETVKALAAEIFDDDRRMVRIDMSEYMEAHSVSRLIGSPPGYVGHGQGGELSEPVRRTPYTVVLFDEIEKAHPRILDLLLQTFDDGHLTDANGRLVNFKNTLLVMTSNLPLQLESSAKDPTFDDEVRKELGKHLRPELVGRIDEVVLFRELRAQHMEQLLQRKLSELNNRLAERQFRILLGPKLEREILELATLGSSGGRGMRRAFDSLVVDATAERILQAPASCKGAWQIERAEGRALSWTEDFSLHRYLKASAA
ncbi:MAG: AAA family ATPase [Oligoflexales bacterium]|nr:AAA family ATPase [Oligoflexales bacterium]